MDLIRRETRYVTGVSPELGGSGDPSVATAYGVWWAMKAVAGRLWGAGASETLAGRRIVVSGVGKVGSSLVGMLVEDGATVAVADVVPAAVARLVERHGVEAVDVEAAHTVPCDIFSPCALGGVLDSVRIPQLGCAAVVGSFSTSRQTVPTSTHTLLFGGTLCTSSARRKVSIPMLAFGS